MLNLTIALFEINEKSYVGVDNGKSWNGFATPMFTQEIANQILQDVCDETENASFSFDDDNDKFIFNDGVYDDAVEFECINIEGLKLYAIGAYSWTWSRV